MKLVGCWFSFRGDAPCLRESVEHWREFVGGEVAIFDEQVKPIPDDHLRPFVAEGDMVERTGWPRGGNLNGWDAVLGILDSMERACLRFGATHAFKIDCDTLARLGPWFDPHKPVSGGELGAIPLQSGSCYALRNDAISTLLDSLMHPDRELHGGPNVMEDWTIGAECLRLFPGQVSLAIRGIGPRQFSGWQYAKSELWPPEYYRDIPVVTFGNRAQIKEGSNCERREHAAATMAAFRKKLKQWHVR